MAGARRRGGLALVVAAVLAAASSAAPLEVRRLSFAQALELAVGNNVSTRLSRADSEAARAEVLFAASRLLPTVTGTASESRVFRENLRALGFTSGPFPALIGPFDVFDARIQLVQSLLDVSAIRRLQSSRRRAEQAREEERLADEQVAAAAGLSYIEALRAAKQTQVAQADLDLALALQSLARDQHRAGTSTGIDQARASTRASEARLKSLQAHTAEREAELRLKRVLGLPLGAPVALTDSLGFSTVPAPGEEEAVAAALRERLELKIAAARASADGYAVKAARDLNLPSVVASGNYGLSGNLPDGSRLTGSAGLALQVPLWAGGAVAAETRRAKAAASRSESALQDMAQQVEEDVRSALEVLETAAEQVRTADETVRLAQREVRLARDRFLAGVADNVELVAAQDVLARSLDAQLAALSQFHVARVNLALSLGRMGAYRL